MKHPSASLPAELPLQRGSGAMSASSEPAPAPAPAPHKRRGGRLRWLVAALAVSLLLMLALMLALVLWWGWQPASFDVAAATRAEVGQGGDQSVAGVAFTATTIAVAETLLEKPGGFLHNDRLPPGALMHNGPSWECGGVMAVRDAVQALRDDFSRAQTQSIENLDVRRADMHFAMDPKAWMLPAAEDSYREGIDDLRAYLGNLANGRAVFYPRADNLAAYLGLVEKRLGNFGVRLAASAGGGLAPGAAAFGAAPSAGDGLAAGDLASARVAEVFYCARGYAWALAHLMIAVQQDFAPVLADKSADAQVARIVQDLSGAIKRLRSPVVLNGGGFGFLANHSLVAGSYIARVNAAVIDLRLLLEQG